MSLLTFKTERKDSQRTQIYKGDPRSRILPYVMVSSAMGLKLGIFPHRATFYTLFYAPTAVDAGDIRT